MIRGKFYKDITATIDKHSRFDSTDFKLEYVKDQRNTHTLLTIKYTIEPKYKISFKIPTSTTTDKDGYMAPYYEFTGSVCPGPLSYEETFSFKGEDIVYNKISTWLNCIWEELSANPVVKQVEQQQQQIDKILEKFDAIKDDYFSNDEAIELRKRLDELERTLQEQIKQTVEDRKLFEEEVEKLHIDIDTLKETIHSFKKKGWLKSFTGKVFKWTKDSENRRMLKDGYTVIREFLPDEYKNALPPSNE